MKKVVLTLLSMMLAMGMQAQTSRVLHEDDTIVGKKEVKIHKEVFYKIRESDNVENSANYVLREVAEFMKKYEDCSITLTGYADRGTGNPKLNVMYAMNRATKFKNDLVTRYGIDPKRIQADSKGDTVQPFADNDKNRCVIVDGTGYELIVEKKKLTKADDMAELLRLQAQHKKDSLYLAEMARHKVDTVVIHHTDTVLVNPFGECNKPERPFGLNKCNRWKNWFITAGVGPAIFQGDHNAESKFKDRLYPAFDLSVGKWFYPAIGVRAGVNLDVLHSYYNANANRPNPLAGKYGEFVHGASPDNPYKDAHWLYKMTYNSFNFHADVMFNFSSLVVSPYYRRFWNIIAYGGIGCITKWDYGHHDWFNYAVSWNAGLLNSFRVSERIDINLDLRLKMFDDDFNCFRQGRGLEGITNLMVGLTWHFTERGF